MPKYLCSVDGIIQWHSDEEVSTHYATDLLAVDGFLAEYGEHKVDRVYRVAAHDIYEVIYDKKIVDKVNKL